jgi:hypothetical protein
MSLTSKGFSLYQLMKAKHKLVLHLVVAIMDWKIDSSSMPSYLRIETDGAASSESFAAMWGEILASDLWRPGLTVLIDNRKLSAIKDADGFTMAAIDYFAKNTALIGKACISVVSSRPENFKYARQFQYGIRLNGSDAVIQVFSTEKQAVEWLDHYSGLRHSEINRVTA